MSNIVLNKNGATIKITNNSNIVYNYDNGIISPTIIDNITSKIDEIRPISIKIPSFVTYRETTLQPGDSITFETTDTDEILYYTNLSTSLTPGISVIVTPNESGGGGGGDISAKSIKFIDYDGTTLYAYTPDEFSALSEMPENPIHSGLTSQGWNWTLSDAKSYVSNYNSLIIGQMYITDDGNTRLYITLSEGRLSPYLGLCPNGTLTIDWGDGTPTETMTGDSENTLVYLPHTYTSAGDYVITIIPNEESTFGFGTRDNKSTIFCKAPDDTINDRYVYLNILNSITIGSHIANIGIKAFNECYALTSVTIAYGVTNIGNYAFLHCYSLKSITIPLSITSIESFTFSGCFSLKSISLPLSVTYIDVQAFFDCYLLESLTIPSSVTSIGDSAFYNCSSLAYVTIPSSVTNTASNMFHNCDSLASITISPGVTSIGGDSFSGCTSLTSITIPSSVTNIGGHTFSNCYCLESITIPSSVTSIGGNIFTLCYSLKSVTIPSSVISIGSSAFSSCFNLESIILPPNITNIGSNTFYNCYSLASITIPSTVTSIGTYAFQYCYGLGFVHFSSQTPPSITSSTFKGVPTDCIIYAPALVINQYMNTKYYPDKSTYTYIGFATYNEGETLPNKTSDDTYTLTWYETVEDLKSQTNPITVGNGNEVYASAIAI